MDGVLALLKKWELSAKLHTFKFGEVLGLLLFPFWGLDLEFFAWSSVLLVVKSVKKCSNDTEGFWDNSSNFSTMVTSQSNLDFKVNHGNTSKGTSHPKLLVVDASRVHAEQEVWDTCGFLSLI